MESIVNYSSDDEPDNTGDKYADDRNTQSDVNSSSATSRRDEERHRSDTHRRNFKEMSGDNASHRPKEKTVDHREKDYYRASKKDHRRDEGDRRKSRDNKSSRDQSHKDERERNYREDRDREDRRDRKRDYRADRRKSDHYRDRGDRDYEKPRRDRHRDRELEKRMRSESPAKDRNRSERRKRSRSKSCDRNVSASSYTNNARLENSANSSHVSQIPPRSSPLIETVVSVPLNTTASIPPLMGSTSNPANNSAALPSYYNPNVINPTKYIEQVQKRKLIWGAKKADDTASKWNNAKFSQDSDGKVQSKFMRLMGIKSGPKSEDESSSSSVGRPADIKTREDMFSSMEQQYEVARQVTHTMRGVGLGFSSQQPRQF